MHNFQCQTVSKSPFQNYLPTTQAAYYLTNSILCISTLPPSNSFISDLAYTTCTNSILRSSFNYKKLLKFENFANFIS